MADSTRYPDATLLLADRALTPLITSARSEQQLASISSLSRAALLTQEAALRLGLGAPERVMVEHDHSGPLVLHAFIDPLVAGSTASEPTIPVRNGEDARDSQRASESNALTATVRQESPAVAPANAPPLLLSTVIVPSAEFALEARRATARLERVGRQIQGRWTAMQHRDEPATA